MKSSVSAEEAIEARNEESRERTEFDGLHFRSHQNVLFELHDLVMVLVDDSDGVVDHYGGSKRGRVAVSL